MCKFSIRQNDGKTDLLELSEWWNGTSVDNYSIEPIMSGSQGTRFRLEGDVLYYYFELEGTDGMTYSASDITIKLSPLALLIEGNQEVNDIIICIDGEEKNNYERWGSRQDGHKHKAQQRWLPVTYVWFHGSI